MTRIGTTEEDLRTAPASHPEKSSDRCAPQGSPLRKGVCPLLRKSLGRYWRKGLVALALIALSAGPASAGEPPYPILFIHGINSSHLMWTDAGLIQALGLRYGASGYPTGDCLPEQDCLREDEVLKFCLNYDDQQATNNLLFEELPLGGTPGNPAVDMVGWLPTDLTSGIASQRFFRLTFDVTQAGSLDPDWLTEVGSNEEAILKQGRAVGIAVKRILDLTAAKKVILIGHSMGGLAARAYLQWGHSPPGNPGDFWAKPEETSGGHRVAKLVTLGTPHLGSNLAEMGVAIAGSINPLRNAARDLAHEHYLFTSDTAPFLFGGNEACVPPRPPFASSCPGEGVGSPFLSRDVDCNGTEGDDVLGLNAAAGATDNPLAPLPTDVEYVWIIGDRFNPDGDCAVQAARQYLSSPGESISIRAAHVSACGGLCSEAESNDVIVEALDEPDWYVSSFKGGAWPISGRAVTGFITHQWNPESSQDDDWFSFEVPAGSLQRVTVDRDVAPGQPHPDVRQLEVLTESGTPLGSSVGSGTTVLSTEVMAPAGAGNAKVLVHVGGTAIDNSDLQNPCDSHAVSTSAGRAYRVVLSDGTGAVTLNVVPALVGPGQATTAQATVRKSDGTTPLPGVTVTFSTFLAGQFGGCTPVAAGCQSVTNASGLATATFTPNAAGTGQILATASTGGSASASLTVSQGTSTVTANPNPAFYNQPATLTATLRTAQGTAVPQGTVVTFSTGFPGRFAQANPTCTYSPCTAVTNASGAASLLFTPQSTGTANLTVEAQGVAAQVLQLPVLDPAAGARISISLVYWSATATSTTYKIQAVVTNSSGSPIVGQRVNFSATPATWPVNPSYADTGTAGIANASIEVTSSGELTITATAAGATASATINAQVGGGGGGPMPGRSLALGTTGLSTGVAFSPDGAVLVASGYSNKLKAWNTSDYSARWSTTARDNAYQVSVSSDSNTLLVGTLDGVELHSMTNGTRSCYWSNPDSNGTLAAWSGAASFFSAAFSTSSWGVYKHGSSCPGSKVLNIETEELSHIDCVRSTGMCAVGSFDSYVYVWNAQGTQVARLLPKPTDAAGDVAFSADGTKLAAVSNGVVNVYSTSTWSLITGLSPSNMPDLDRYSVTFLDNDSKIAIGGRGVVEVLDYPAGTSSRVGTFPGLAYELAWNPVTKDLAANGSGGSVVVYRPLDPLDTSGPVISVSSPAEGLATVDASITVTGTITDQNQITSARLNGSALTLDVAGGFSTGAALLEGLNTLAFEATDSVGNVSSMNRTVVRVVDRTPPVVSSVSLAPAVAPVGTVFLVTCSIVDADTGVATASATARNQAGTAVGTVSLAKLSGSTYQGSITSTGFAVGAYSVDVTAVDSSPQANTRLLTGAGSFSVAGPQTLTVGKSGLGAGTLVSAPSGINCGGVCAATFSYGTPVTLTASGAVGSVFTGWSGGGCSGGGTCQVTMSQARAVTANFDLLPTVSITATDSNAAEQGQNAGQFTVTRTGSTTSQLSLTYTVSGTATAGSDYQALPGTVTIPAGASTVTITVTPIDDAVIENAETVITTLASGGGYTLGTPFNAAVAIADNDRPAPTLTTVAPNSGFTPGGTSVTITGSGFLSGATVSFGGVAATGVSFVNSTTVSAIAPAHAPGLVGVSVTNPDLQAVSQSGGFFYKAPPVPSRYYIVTPCRLFDTRNTTGPSAAAPILAANETRTFDVSGRCGIPENAVSLTINVTVTGTGASGELRLFPGNGISPYPPASAIFFGAGKTRANNGMALLATDGTATVKVQNLSAGNLHFILDVSGYYLAVP